jgi:hypothetical protein
MATTKRMRPAELRETCICAAATAVVAHVVGAGYEDIFVNDDQYRWPTSRSKVFVKGWRGDNPPPADVLERMCMVYEAGLMAVAKLRGYGAHVIVGFQPLPRFLAGGDLATKALLDRPVIWGAVKALAQRVEDNYEGDGCYGAMAKHDDQDAAIGLLKERGLYAGWWLDHRDDDDDGRGEPDAGPSPDNDGVAPKVLERVS